MTDRHEDAVVLVIVPTVNRPGNLRPLAENIREATRSEAVTVFVTEKEDQASQEVFPAVTALAVVAVNDRRRCYAGAFNSGYFRAVRLGVPFTHVFLGTDDAVFHSGWDVPALAALTVRPELRVAGTNDLNNPLVMAGRIASHFLVDRRYIDKAGGVMDEQPGVVLCEAYRHAGAFAEFQETVCARGVWTPCLGSVVEHRLGPDSKSLDPQTGLFDTALFMSRRPLWENWRSQP